MALEAAWYDLVCYGMVSVAIVCALWVLGMNEGASQRDFDSTYESLLLSRPDNEVIVNVLPRGHVSTSQLWTSCWLGFHPFYLLVTRFLSFPILVVFFVLDVLQYGESIFVYYTESGLSHWLPYILRSMGTIVSAQGCWQFFNKLLVENGEKAEFLKRETEEATSQEKESKVSIKLQSRYTEEEFQQRAGFWGYLMQTTYQTCAGAAILTDIVFWGVIVPFLSTSHLRLSPLMGCMHMLNVVLLLLDTALNNLPFPWFRISYFVLWSCGYVIFQWSIHACGFKWWPYPFPELDTKWAPIWYFCLGVIHIPCYGIYCLIVRAKNTILLELFPQAFFRPH